MSDKSEWWDFSKPVEARYHNARRRHRAAVEDWCSSREYSYCMSVLGWRHPSPDEQRRGHITPAPGSKWA